MIYVALFVTALTPNNYIIAVWHVKDAVSLNHFRSNWDYCVHLLPAGRQPSIQFSRSQIAKRHKMNCSSIEPIR